MTATPTADHVFAFDLPDGTQRTVGAASWYDAREFLRAKGITSIPVLLPRCTIRPAWHAPPTHATPTEIAAAHVEAIEVRATRAGYRAGLGKAREILTTYGKGETTVSGARALEEVIEDLDEEIAACEATK